METVLVGLAIAIAQQIPSIIALVKSSTTMSDAEKAAALESLTNSLQATLAAVEAVKFKQV